jgi:MATE family multidrug resistance protein
MKPFRPERARLLHEVRATVHLALPLIAAQLAAIGSNVIDTMLSGHYSAHVMAAVAVGASIWSLAIVSGIGMMMAVPPSVAQLDGAGRRPEVGAVFHQARWLALGMGVLLWFAVRHAAPLIDLIGVTPSLRDEVQRFLLAISWGAPALTCYFALRGLSEGLSLTRPSMYFSLGGLALLVPLGYVLMFGKLGIPPQGAHGCGVATATVLWLEMLAFACYVMRHRNYRGLGLFDHFERPQLRRIGALIHIGLPMAVSLLAEAGLFVATALIIATLGEDVIASHQVALNIASLFFMIPLGLAMAITVRVGNAVGRGDARGVRYAGFCGIGLTLLTQLFSAGLMLTLPHYIAALYTNDPKVIALAMQLIMLAGLFQFSDGIQVASNGALRGLKDTRIPMAITLFAYWIIGMPVGWWLAFHHGLGARGMWMGLIAGLSVAAVMLFTRFWRSAWKQRWRAHDHGGPTGYAATLTSVEERA